MEEDFDTIRFPAIPPETPANFTVTRLAVRGGPPFIAAVTLWDRLAVWQRDRVAVWSNRPAVWPRIHHTAVLMEHRRVCTTLTPV